MDGIELKEKYKTRIENMETPRPRAKTGNPDAQQRYCKKCDTWKPQTEFYKNRNGPGGLAYYCKDCDKQSKKEKYQKKKTGIVDYEPVQIKDIREDRTETTVDIRVIVDTEKRLKQLIIEDMTTTCQNDQPINLHLKILNLLESE